MARKSQDGHTGTRQRPDADSRAPVVGDADNPSRKSDGGDERGDGVREGHNDDKGEGRGVAGGGKNQGKRK